MLGLFLAFSVGLPNQASLLDKYLIARHAGASHQDDERHVSIARCNHRRNHASLAVPDEANAMRVDLRTRLEKRNARFSVIGKVSAGRGVGVSSRLANATLVGSKHHYALAREIVRHHEKRLMSHEAFVAVMRPRSRYQHH